MWRLNALLRKKCLSRSSKIKTPGSELKQIKGNVMFQTIKNGINKKNFGRVMFKFLRIMSYIETFERVCRLIRKFCRWL